MLFDDFCRKVKLPNELEEEFFDFIIDGSLISTAGFDIRTLEASEDDFNSEYQEFVVESHPELIDDNEEDVDEDEDESEDEK